MEKIVYIDAERVDGSILTKALKPVKSQEEYSIVLLNDTIVEEGLLAGYKTIESHRNHQTYKKDLFNFIEGVFVGCYKKPKMSWLKYKNVDLLEVIWYEFAFAFDKYFHRYWALNQIKSRWNPKEIYALYEISNENDLYEIRNLKKISSEKFKMSYYFNHDMSTTYFGKYRILKEYKRLYASEIIKYKRKKSINRNLSKKIYDILFFEQYPNSSKIAVHLLRKMQEKGKECAFLSSKTKRLTTDSTFDNYLMDDFCRSTVIKRIVLHFYYSIKVRFQLKKRYNNQNVNKYLIEGITLYSIKPLYNALYYLLGFQKMAKAIHVKHMISTSYSAIFARAYCLYFKNVRSHYVQHGLIGHAEYFYRFLQDYVYVWGQKNKNKIEKVIDIKTQRVIVSGNPKSDKRFLLEDQFCSKDIEVEKQSKKKEQYNIVYFSSRVGGVGLSKAGSVEHLQVILNGINSHNNIELIIKMHPGDGVELYSPFIKHTNNVRIVTHRNSGYWIAISDACIVSTSTVGLEVCQFKKPLLFLHLNENTRFGLEYLKYNATYNIQNSSDMSETINDLLKNNCRNKFINGQKKILADYHQDFNINLLMNYL